MPYMVSKARQPATGKVAGRYKPTSNSFGSWWFRNAKYFETMEDGLAHFMFDMGHTSAKERDLALNGKTEKSPVIRRVVTTGKILFPNPPDDDWTGARD